MAKNQLNQPMLNLIMFYHNHRVYKAGKRKGYSPMELLTGKKQQHWLEALTQQVAKDVAKLDAS